jgi:hypothetical protein
MLDRHRRVDHVAAVERARAGTGRLVRVDERSRDVRRRRVERHVALDRAGAGEAVRARRRADYLLAVAAVREVLRPERGVAREERRALTAEQRRELGAGSSSDLAARVAGPQVLGRARQLHDALRRVVPVADPHRQLLRPRAPDVVERELRRLEVERRATEPWVELTQLEGHPGRVRGGEAPRAAP